VTLPGYEAGEGAATARKLMQFFHLLTICLSVCLSVCLSIYLSMALQPLWTLAAFFSFLIWTQSVGPLGWGISLSQGRHHHTQQHKHRINAHWHQCLVWDSNPRSQCSSGWREFMPQTARPLWAAAPYRRDSYLIYMDVKLVFLVYGKSWSVWE
jgi:hypothetical protein